MKGTPSVRRSAFLRMVALGVTLAVVPLPVAAAESSPPTPPVTLHAAIAKAASTERLVTGSRTAAQQTGQTAATDPRLQSPSFFKTPLGVAVIGIVGAGAAYAVYSASHDRIHSTYR